MSGHNWFPIVVKYLPFSFNDKCLLFVKIEMNDCNFTHLFKATRKMLETGYVVWSFNLVKRFLSKNVASLKKEF